MHLVISHMSGVRCQLSGARSQVSGVRCLVSHVRCHLKLPNHKKRFTFPICLLLHVRCHLSCVMCHLEYVFSSYFFTKWQSYLVEVGKLVAYQVCCMGLELEQEFVKATKGRLQLKILVVFTTKTVTVTVTAIL